MNNGLVTLLVALIGLAGGGGGIWAALTIGTAKRKMLAEAKATEAGTVTVLTKAAVDLVEPLQERIRELEGESRELRKELRGARGEIRQLTADIAQLRKELNIEREKNKNLNGR